MPDFKFAAQFPIDDEDVSMSALREQAAEQLRVMVFNLGFALTGAPVFELLDLPTGMHLSCVVPVEELTFGGGRRGK